jgi:hypothetical protein
MQRFAHWTTLVGVLGLLATANVAYADEEAIPPGKLPKAVLKAVKDRFPGAEIEKAIKEEAVGETTYEVVLDHKGHAVDVALKGDGTILEIESEIPVEKLPPAVKRALATKYPKAKIEKVEELIKGKGTPVLYEATILTEIVLSGKGKVIEASGEEGEENTASAEESKEDEEHEKAAKAKKSKKESKEDEDDDEHEKAAKAKKSKKESREDEDGDDDADDEDEQDDYEDGDNNDDK